MCLGPSFGKLGMRCLGGEALSLRLRLQEPADRLKCSICISCATRVRRVSMLRREISGAFGDPQAKMPTGAPGASAGRPANSVRMLAAYFDAAAGYSAGAAGAEGHAELQGLRLESHINLNSDEVEKRLASMSPQARPPAPSRPPEPCSLSSPVSGTAHPFSGDPKVETLECCLLPKL